MDIITPDMVMDYVKQRAADHGLSVADVLEMIPDDVIDSPAETYMLLQEKDLSHIMPQSTHPELADDPGNVFLEDPGPNRSAGARVRTAEEIEAAEQDLLDDAARIDADITIGDNNEEWIEMIEEVLESVEEVLA